MAPLVAVGPAPVAPWVADAVRGGGGSIVDPDAADALVWTSPRGAGDLQALLASAPSIRWVQLPWAGVEEYAAAGVFADASRQWTCGKGVYAEPVAEHALALALAGLRSVPERVRAISWGRQAGVSLFDAKVTIVGGGGITEALVALLRPLRAEITVVRRRPEPLDGVARVLPPEGLAEALPGASVVFLTLALTPETEGIIGSAELALMGPSAWLVNVARGRHIVTDDLVEALRSGRIGGAGLDVTDPEPLPEGHPLWDLPNVIITPHTANTQEMARPLLAARISDNVRRFAAGEQLVGTVDAAQGY